VRTLVFRGWADGDAFDLLSDGRSAKAAELQRKPAVELCWLLPRARCQFRLRGAVVILPSEQDQKERRQHWQTLSPSGRALWAWPEPGVPLQAGAPFPAELADDTPLPGHFRLLRIAVDQVELLELTAHPHRRRRWCRDGGWAEEPLNP
jgi:pyridoxamine 5'-phosphate oxidase